MNSQNQKPRPASRWRDRDWVNGLVCSALALVAGLVLLFTHAGDFLTRVSYDLPFALRSTRPANEAAIVYIDENSHKELEQPFTAPWDRSLHARLIDRLTAEGAKAIVFDVLFVDASAENPAGDIALAQAIKRSGRVVLGANYNKAQTALGDAPTQWEELPYEPFRAAAAAWGNVNFFTHPDYGIREFFITMHDLSGQKEIRWLPEAVAQFVSGGNMPAPASRRAYLNYFGPPGTIPGVSYARALSPGDVPPGVWRDKIVFVGARLSADYSGKSKDEFRTPYTYIGRAFAPGVEVHATATLNLLRRNWLTRVPALLEAAVVMLVAFLSGIRLVRVQPLASTLGAAGGILIVSLTAILLSWEFNLWFAWAIPAFTIFAAWVCSIVYTSVNLHIQKRLLEDSLAAHLSPKLVRRLIQEPALRQQGGYQQEISILFSDIANFSKVSECLSSDDLVRLMNKYFDASLNCIHQHDGTVVKLIGDAIFAIWNAPVEQPTHREHACRAALSLRDQLVKFDADRGTLPLRTRIGLHAGTASVGNIGSSTRFDYTALGENINLASRLEGLNKYLGTDVLVSREVQKGSDGAMVWRPAGHFKLKGSSRILEVYELVSSADDAERSRAWREKFAEALVDFRSRRFDLAEEKFKECSRLRLQAERVPAPTNSPVPADGPSVFYLQRIEEFRLHPPGSDWLGEVELSDK